MAKKNQPHIPLYIGDWERDCNVLSVEAEGAWLRIVLKMFTNGKQSAYKVPAKGLQNLWKCDEDKMNEILTELQDNDIGVIKRDGRFIEFVCRRFEKENEISQIRSKAGGANKTSTKGKQRSNKSKANIQQTPDNDSDSDSDINNDYDYDINSIKADSFFYEQLQMNFKSRFESFDVKWDHAIEQFDLKIQGSELKDRPKTLNQLKARITKYLNTWIARLETESKNGKAKRANKGHRSTARVDTSRGPGKL